MKTIPDHELADIGVGIAHHFGGGAYIKETFIPAGTSLTQHAHDHDHLSYLVSGSVSVTVNGEVFPAQGPSCMKIRAGKMHEVHAHTPSIWLCVWATECADPAEVDKVLTNG